MSENTRTASAGIKLLIFVVLTSLATAVLAVTISNTSFKDARTYKAIFTDVAGVLTGDDVRVAGVRVGEVKKIDLFQGDKARVTFTVAKEGIFAGGLPKSVTAQVRYRNLAGQRYISLSEGPGSAADVLSPGGTIPISQTTPALDLTVLFNGFRPLFKAVAPEDVNKLSFEIVQTLQGEAGTVNGLLAHVASLTNTLADRDKVIGDVITNLNQVLGTIDQRHEQVSTLIVNLQSFVSGVAGDRQAIFDSIGAINDLTGVTSDLLIKARPSVKQDIAGLNKVAGTLADNSGSLDTALRQAPERLNKLANASSYGSWFNFYLCALDARVALPGGPAYQTPAIINDNARCK
ncbi:MAG: phospholipid/cholesterol/gamma-HCH transport system substrate-binding protein [Streptosporangiaceae bacterium]|jgi:phospholipid/cholesterol/gamma-HCH transport system substrate-binding protein|nr:virulence factor Mce family protein [Streptosporangiaceae bacterium]MDX6431556.1 phospholipid/cholesterol/gamma-HCH transport system substrate-binding protein [Streptosporangiaceae bacterium]